MKGRDISLFVLAFLAGNFFGGWLTLPPLAYLVMGVAAAIAALSLRPCAILAAFFLLGAASVQVSRMPPAGGESLLKTRFSEFKAAASARVGEMVDDCDSQAVLKALAVGDKGDISTSLKESYRRSGAMHLLALPGLHVGIIYKILCGLLFFLGGTLRLRRLRSALVLAMLWLFALMSGMSPSIARASLMITIYELSPMARSEKDGIRALAAAALLICLADPEASRSVGFQLSFCACLSLFTLFPFLRSLLETRMLLLRRVWEMLCVAISCQMATAPLSYLYFGTFPRYFLLSNILAVPLSGAALYLTAFSVLFARFPVLSLVTSRMLGAILLLLNWVVAIVAQL